MGFEYLTNVPLKQAKEEYLNFLVQKGFRSKTEIISVQQACGR